MRKLSIILIILIGSSMASKAQIAKLDTIVRIDIAQTTLKNALNTIAEEYQIKFSYSDSKIKAERLVSARYDQISLNDFFKAFFDKYAINYSIIDQQIVLFPFNSNQSIIVKGKVVNRLDQSPIPFANIVLPGTGRGTSSNEEGEFELSITDLPTELMVSHLAHEKKLVYIYNEDDELLISLMPAQKELEEVTIKSRGNKNAYYNMIRKAYEKLRKVQYNDQFGKAFYRQKSSRENQYTEILEMFYDIRYSPLGIEDWAVQEGRYAFQKEEEYDIFLYNKNFTLLSRMFPMMQPNTDSYILPVSPDVKKYFDLSLQDIIKYENRYIAIIDYEPNSLVQIPAPSGQLYIDFEDYSILKFNGHFDNSDLNIVGFSDEKSSWENYRLGFEISYIDDQGDNLRLDFIKIDHRFDYYYDSMYIGKIKTNSFLTFYEYYTPAGNKKLGGPIDYKTSDIELIDRMGYNPTFWRQNPIVKRTPIEEKLILDFEQNEAFGSVFMNNDEQVVLLPDHKQSEAAEKIIAQFENQLHDQSQHELFLRLDKYHYQPSEKIRLAGYIYDKWSFSPQVAGSVLTVDLKKNDNKVILTNNFDIKDGAVYGEVDLSKISESGIFQIEAFTNVNKDAVFTTNIEIFPFSASIRQNQILSQKPKTIKIASESGILLAGIPTRVVYDLTAIKDLSLTDTWKIIDEYGEIVKKIQPGNSAIGSFSFTPEYDQSYFMVDEDSLHKIDFPQVVPTGISIKVDSERGRSLKLRISQRPALPRDIFLLSAFKGKVTSIMQTILNGRTNTIDLPIQYLKSGINELIVLDENGERLATRKIFNAPADINIDLLSARWRSKRNHRLELELEITDKNGKPIEPNLSVVATYEKVTNCSHCDIRNEILLGDAPWAERVNFDLPGDSTYTAIDNLLILDQKINQVANTGKEASYESYTLSNSVIQDEIPEDELFAEVSISGSMSSQNSESKKIRNNKKAIQESEIHWIPRLNIDHQGTAAFELNVPNKNQLLYINIQGLSKDGIPVNHTIKIDLSTIRYEKNRLK